MIAHLYLRGCPSQCKYIEHETKLLSIGNVLRDDICKKVTVLQDI